MRGIKEFLDGEDDTVTRRKFLEAAGAAGATAATAGCINTGANQNTTTETPTPTENTPTTEEPTTTTQEDTTTEQEPIEQIDPSEVDNEEQYGASLPRVNNYNQKIDSHELQELLEDKDRQEQVQTLHEEVGKQYEDWQKGNRAIIQALHKELDWFNFNDGARADLETSYSGQAGEMIVTSYEDENGNTHRDGMAARDEHSTERYYIPDLPNSEFLDSDGADSLAWDIGSKTTQIEEASKDAPRNVLENWHIGLQSILWDNEGISIDGGGKESYIVFSKDALDHIYSAYKESAEAGREVKDRVNRLYTAADKVRESGQYIKMGVENEELDISGLLSEDKAQEMIYDQTRYEI